MLDLLNRTPNAAQQAVSQSAAYERYLQQQEGTGGVPMSAAQFERYSLGSDWLGGLKDAARKLVQTCRLMVGIHDYEYYLQHMRERHPDSKPFSRDEFYRYCLEARYPSADNANGGKCPC